MVGEMNYWLPQFTQSGSSVWRIDPPHFDPHPHELLARTLREVSVGRLVRTMREVREVTRKEEVYGGW